MLSAIVAAFGSIQTCSSHAIIKKSSGLGDGTMVLCTALDLVDHFDFRPILECKKLEEIYFDGIYVGVHGGGSPTNLDSLVPLAKWLMKAFLVRRVQKVQVEVGRQWGRWNGRVAGSFIQLNDNDMEDVTREIEKDQDEMADATAACEMS
jgi:hypothetical protein